MLKELEFRLSLMTPEISMHMFGIWTEILC
jgi:hypothetical protein